MNDLYPFIAWLFVHWQLIGLLAAVLGGLTWLVDRHPEAAERICDRVMR